jgi:hypothetical protein
MGVILVKIVSFTDGLRGRAAALQARRPGDAGSRQP